MNIVFRVDGSLEIGTGHVMRCITLADEFRRNGVACHFITREQPGSLQSLIRDRGHVCHCLPEIHSELRDNAELGLLADEDCFLKYEGWLLGGWENDADQSFEIAQSIKPDWVIVDHYAIDDRWETILAGCCKSLMVIDDLANRRHNCKVLLDQTYGRSSEFYRELVPPGCELLCGAQYALLRPQFEHMRDFSLSRRESPRLHNLLITMGGVDQGDITSLVLDSLVGSGLPMSCQITVVMGKTAPWLDNVREKANDSPWPVAVLVGVQQMAEVMTYSDLAICAAGSTTWECCCLGLPSILIVAAANQKEGCKVLTSQIACPMIESVDQIRSELSSKIHCFLGNMPAMDNCTQQMKTVTSGLGVKMVCGVISRNNTSKLESV
ncbi:MAG: UDP-2,4-diacetamido-2,4,6-trideoxy-beta-L-altropyranose hydrolase [Candidatus Azotimanducaceae bacterium]|jgi:UDP-2,4-diacetamido-2,4,6-trideoxy-beta-L-altropyranose hydrolase